MSETYGQTVRRLRKAMGLTQQGLADASGVPMRTIQDIEADRGNPQRATRLPLNQYLGIEGDVDQERAEWPNDVTVILDIVGAFLMKMTPEARRLWLKDLLENPRLSR